MPTKKTVGKKNAENREEGVKVSVPLAILAAGAIIAVAIFFTGGRGGVRIAEETRGQEAAALEGQNNSPAIANVKPVNTNDHILGNPNAELFLIEFSDMECPFCKRFHQTAHTLIDEYGKDGTVAWVYRHFPIPSIHSKAPTEALATECVAELGGNEIFWQYLDKIFEITPANNGLDLALLPELAEELGIDTEEFNECMESDRLEELVDADVKDGLAAGVSGTPHSILIARNGKTYTIRGAQPIETLREVIELALEEIES